MLGSIPRILKRRLPRQDDVEQRRVAWDEATTRWIDFVRPVRLCRAPGMTRQEGGVLVMRLDTADIVSMLSGAELTGRKPFWLNFSEFTALLSDTDGLPPGTAERWAARIERLDPRRDVVLFMLSTPDAEGRSFSRIVALPDATTRPETTVAHPDAFVPA